MADHNVSPGKKQWTWGNGDFGKAGDRDLTDEDGPYVELMTGKYTDNRPDFTWLQPYEEKSWVQYFMPYSEVGLSLIHIDVGVHRYIYSDGGQLKLWLDLEHSANKESWNRRIIQSQIRVVSPTVVEDVSYTHL